MGQSVREDEFGKQRKEPLEANPTVRPLSPGQAAKEAEGGEDALTTAADLQRKLDELEKALDELAKKS